jgi:hypothetical protein
MQARLHGMEASCWSTNMAEQKTIVDPQRSFAKDEAFDKKTARIKRGQSIQWDNISVIMAAFLIDSM